MKDVSITLVNESCFSFLKELESNSIDLALIDPPYEVSRETNFKSGEAKGKDTDRFRVSMDFPVSIAFGIKFSNINRSCIRHHYFVMFFEPDEKYKKLNFIKIESRSCDLLFDL